MFSQSLPRREFALSVQTRAKTPATISPNYLLGESRAGHSHPMYYGCGRLQPSNTLVVGKSLLFQGVLIHGMCLFEDGTRAARRREKRTPSLTKSTSEQTSLDSFRPRTSGTAFSRFVLQTPRMPFVACNELAIATKSIASVLSPATRSPWVPSRHAEGER